MRRGSFTKRPTDSEMRRYATSLSELAEPARWVIVRADGNSRSFDCHTDGGVYYWKTEDAARVSMASMFRSSQLKREVRRLTQRELEALDDAMILVTPNAKRLDMPKKTTSVGCLVDIFEDYESRKFAIATKASTEDEFVVEVAQAMAASGSSAWDVRLREMLPLIVDMCCKYRGYKAERVLERRELVAGDLDIPVQVNQQ